jgi:hypothetical protein
MKRLLNKIIVALIVFAVTSVLLYVNKIAYYRLSTLLLLLTNLSTLIYVVFMVKNLINHFENENDVQEQEW